MLEIQRALLSAEAPDGLLPRDFQRICRLDSSTFTSLCEELAATPPVRACYRKRRGRPAYPFTLRLLVALHRFGTGRSVDAVAYTFGVTESVVHLACELVMEACSFLEANYVRWPSAAERRQLCEAGRLVQANRNGAFAGVVGMMDGSHIRIGPTIPKEQAASFRNRKGFQSIGLAAVVDHTGRFLTVMAGAPGCANDQGMLNRSAFGTTLLADRQRLLSDGEYLLVDSGYQPTAYLVGPYPDWEAARGSPQRVFNYAHAVLRNPVERAFGRLKGRWRCLLELPVHHTRGQALIRACVFMHNFCIAKNDPTDIEEAAEEPVSEQLQAPVAHQGARALMDSIMVTLQE
jgi:hypothetical protein